MLRRRAYLWEFGPVEVTYAEVFIDAAGFRRTQAVLQSWTDEQLAEIGVVAIAEATVPYGYRAIPAAWPLAIVEGQVVDAIELEERPTADLVAGLIEEIRAERWTRETAGILVGGARVATDEKAQGKVTGAVVLLDNDPARDGVNWEAEPGVFVTIPRAAMKALGLAVGQHVQACFDRSKALCEAARAAALQADPIAALAAMKTTIKQGWPATAAEGASE